MKGTSEGIVLKLFICSVVVSAQLCFATALSYAEPLLLVYPNKPAEFRYNPAEYELLTPSSPQYDPDFDVGGVMLWDKIEQRIAHEVYRAPNITRFRTSSSGMNEFVILVNEFTLVVDGYCEYPRQLNELYVRFIPDPPHASTLVILNGEPIEYLIMPIPGIDVQTPTPEGCYSDTRNIHIAWSASVGLRVTVYGDKNGNRIYDGGVPKWSIYVMDNTVPVKETTWGAIKALYGSESN
jgi:hypothetical protein